MWGPRRLLSVLVGGPGRPAEARPGLLTDLRRGQKRFEAWRNAPLTLVRMAAKDRTLQRHAERMEEFLRIVADRAGASVVVESSYSALRGMLYRRASLGGGRVRFIHLVRDGRSFFGSELGPAYGTHPGSPWQRVPPAIVARWTAFHTAAIAFCSRGRGSYLRLRFEDVLLHPKESLGAIQQFLGIDLSEAVRRIEMHQPIAMNHICSANRARLAGALTVRPELAAPSRLSRGTPPCSGRSVAGSPWRWAIDRERKARPCRGRPRRRPEQRGSVYALPSGVACSFLTARRAHGSRGAEGDPEECDHE